MQVRKCPVCDGFSLIEAMVGTALFAVTFFALYSGITYCYTNLQFTRENLRATQIMVAKLEAIRLYSWEQVNDPTYLPRTFVASYVNSAPSSTQSKNGSTTPSGITYQGTVNISDAPMAANYADKLKLVTINLTWNTGNTPRQRSMQSLVTYNGLHTYVY